MANLLQLIKDHKNAVVVGGVVVGLAVVGTLLLRCECCKKKCSSWWCKGKCGKKGEGEKVREA